MNVNGLPTMKSASALPVAPPSKVNTPGDRTFAFVSDSHQASATPKPHWWLPRTIVRSSLKVKLSVVNRDSLSVPPPRLKAPVTLSSM